MKQPGVTGTGHMSRLLYKYESSSIPANSDSSLSIINEPVTRLTISESFDVAVWLDNAVKWKEYGI